MRELGYERAFREWLAARGMKREPFRYPHPAGGETLGYRFSPVAPPRARVVLAHGAGNDALFAFPGFFKELLQRGFEVFSFDLDGHGRASTTRFSSTDAAEILPTALDQARTRGGELPTHLLGLSLGGAITLAALPELGAEAASAILVSAPLRIRFGTRAVLGELRPALFRTALRQRPHLGWLGLIPSFGPVKRGSYPLRLAEPTPGAFGYVDVLNRTLESLRLECKAEAVRTPTLLIYGTADRLVPPEQGERLADLIPRGELLRIPGGTHLTTFFAPAAWKRIFAWLNFEYAVRSTQDRQLMADSRQPNR